MCEEEEGEGEELVVTIGLFALWLAIWGLLVVPWGSVGWLVQVGAQSGGNGGPGSAPRSVGADVRGPTAW